MANELSDGDSAEFDVSGDERDQIFDVLSHPHRRFVLDTLLAAETPVEMGTLSTELAEWMASAPDRSGAERDAVEISLVHGHLPKMADADLIEYDAADRTVTLADRTEEIRTHLRMVENRE